MNELRKIIKTYERAKAEGKNSALATVVKVEGSSYRKAGARMLITEEGQFTGAISGGCLEGDALRKARFAMSQRHPMLVTYDTTDEDDARFGVGLGCNGIIHVLIEPIDDADPLNPISLLQKFFEKRRYAVLVTLFSLEDKKAAQSGTCLFLTESDEIYNQQSYSSLSAEIFDDSRDVLRKKTSLIKTYGETNPITAFIEILKPEISLIVFGAGNDAIPLIQMAAILGWDVTVIDGRPNYASTARFPDTKVLISKPDAWLNEVELDERTACILMSHNYTYDYEVLKRLLKTDVPYIGCLGPKKRTLQMLEEAGLDPKANKLPENLFGPAGLDIMAENSQEIALSILSEIQSVIHNGKAGFLKNKLVGIHVPEIQL
ncbi:XdhC/CoxI family protein [Pedobacter sp. HMF7647]|uniref:XdhC/CoxI family protein n=1 Tax=Hufsiella arboris TaxID=2695275 RepID=A0A7K1Y815_9SPHI|nr:XdhC/CoxI family protein [Hufsiella arboris]MXV50716.1 XdhC/CoxI family protein [Hufsiella arboris]